MAALAEVPERGQPGEGQQGDPAGHAADEVHRGPEGDSPVMKAMRAPEAPAKQEVQDQRPYARKLCVTDELQQSATSMKENHTCCKAKSIKIRDR